jgi:hypothetical protein
MFRSTLIVLAVAMFGLTSCGSTRRVSATVSATAETIAQRQLLIGFWRGSSLITGGGTLNWTIERKADGTFRIDFESAGVKDMPNAFAETGIWGVSGNIYFTATRGFEVDGVVSKARTHEPELYDAYKIIRLEADRFEYQHLSSGNRYVSTRAPARPETHEDDL